MKFKTQILAKLVASYPGLSKHLLGLVADKLAAKVTEESQIEGAVAGLADLPISLQDYAGFLQKEGDRRVTEARTTWEQGQGNGDEGGEGDDGNEPTNPPKPTGKGKPNKGGDDPISKLTAVVTQLATTVANMQKEGTQKTLTEQLHAKLGEKKIPVVFAKGRTVEKAEDLDALVAEIEQDHDAYKQELANQGFSQTSKPLGSNQTPNTDKVDADVVNFAKQQNEKVSQTKS